MYFLLQGGHLLFFGYKKECVYYVWSDLIYKVVFYFYTNLYIFLENFRAYLDGGGNEGEWRKIK